MKKSLVFFMLVLLSACHTIPQETIDRLHKWKEERNKENDAKWHLSKAARLASNFEQQSRKEALPLLLRLIDDHYVKADARFLVSLYEYRGEFGYVDDRRYHEFHAENLAHELEFIRELDEKAEKTIALMKGQPKQVSEIMSDIFSVCEQPLDAWPKKMGGDALDYLHWLYAGKCMKAYSVKNSNKRLLVLAKYNGLNCEASFKIDRCHDDALVAFANGEVLTGSYRENATALDYIVSDHLERWSPRVERRVPMTDFTYMEVRARIKSHELVSMGEYDKAIGLMSEIISKRSDFSADELMLMKSDLAHAHRKRNKGEDSQLAVNLYREAISLKVMDIQNQWMVALELYEYYLELGYYEDYINAVIPLLEARQEKAELIPPATLKKLKAGS